jgi:hypothetical protein
MSNKNVTIKDGIINIPYNFNNEKYIVGIENKETNEIKVSKTIIPIKEAKPSYSLVITPKQYDISGSKVSPFFHVKKNKDGKYSFINSEVIYTVNFIVDDIQIPVSDYTIKTDWDKYNITKSIEPFEIKVSVNDSTTAIESGSTQHTILENSGSFDEEVNIFIDYNDIMFTTTLKTTFQKSYFETISLYDSIDITSRVNETKTMRNVITIDGYYNDNKVEKENLNVKFDLNGDDKFTTLASTMGYIDIVKEKNEWYLEHKELSASSYTGTPLCNYIVDNKGDIYEDGNLIVSGDTLYKENNKNKIIDSSGNTYSGTTKIIDNSGNTKFNSYTTIDNSGNTIYNGTTKIIDNENKIIYSSQGKFITNLNDNKIYSQGSGCTVDITNGVVYSGTTQNVILNENNYIPLQFDDDTYKYNFKDSKLISGNTTLYNNISKQLYISGNTGHTITPSNNEYKVSGTTIIDSNGNVKNISGFNYNIKTGLISTSNGTSLVTAITSYNKGCTNSSTTGYTFNSAYTASNYGYYISDINGIVKYENNNFLLSGQTVFSNDNIVAKYISSLGVRYNGFAGPIKFNFTNSGVTGATGYTYSEDLSQTGVKFKIDNNNTTHNISLQIYRGAILRNVTYNGVTIAGDKELRFVDTNVNLQMNLTVQSGYKITKVEANGVTITSTSNNYNFGNITGNTTIKVHTAYVDPSGNTINQTVSETKTSNIDTTREYHKTISGESILVYNRENHILTYNKTERKITYCKFKNNIVGQFDKNKLIFTLNKQINYVHEYNNGNYYYYISDKNFNKLIILNVILNDEFIKLADNYWLKDRKIYYNSSPSASTICADITSTTIGDNANTTSGTYITNGIIAYKNNNLLNSKSGCTEFSPTLRYYYKDKKLDYYNNKNQTIVNFKENRLYYANAVKVLNLSSNYIINNSGSSLFTTDKIITIYNNIKYDIGRKRVSGDASYSYDFNTKNAVLINTNNLSDGSIKYQNGVTTLQYNANNSIVISGNKINLKLNKGYTLTATTGYVNDVDDANKTIITAITTNVDNRHTYTWDVESKCIKEGDQILTNKNDDRPFYYCNTSGEIIYNKEKVIYVIDDEGEYWNISNGNKILINDKDKSGNSLIFKPKSGKVVPPKEKIEDKYGNIKINKKNSFDKKTGTYRDVDNKVITGVTSGASQYPLDESYYTTIVDLRNKFISDANGRTLMSSNGKSVYIEGGLELTRRDDGTDAAILSENGVVLVSGITGNSIGELTNEANEYGVTKKDDTYYYKNKKLYDSNGAYYFEKLITETTNTGFTLQNGIIIKPKQPEAKTRATIGGSGDRPDYTYGVEIVAGDFVVTITQKDDGQGGGGGGYYPSESGGTENPGFTITDDGLLYLGAKIVDFKDGKIYDMSSLLDINNRIDFTKIPDTTIVHVDADDITIIVDETGKNDVYEIEEKETVYYDSHLVKNIKTYIPDLISYIFKSNKKDSYNLNVETTYMGVMTDKKDYLIVDGGKNHSSYKIKVEPQFITQNMINNGSTVKAYVVNNNGDQIPYATYSGNGYTFKYTTDTNNTINRITGDTFIYTLSTGTPIFNEIKFNLECEGSLINQEIIEVLGENKFITSVDYINNTDSGATLNITPTTNTYYNEKIYWGKENELTGVSYNNYQLTISSGVTGTVVLSGSCKGVKVYEKTVVITKNGDKGEQGKTGETGPQGPQGPEGPKGPRGKLLYPAGRWNSGTTYDGTDDEKTPFVTYKIGDEDKYFVLTAATIISGTSYEPIKSGWTEMAQYEALYTKLLVAENGLVGGSVYNGDYVFSKNGISGKTSITNESGYVDFHPSNVEKIFSGETISNSFVPNYLVDFSKGRAWFGNGNTRILENGTLLSDNIIEMFNTIYLPHREVRTGSTNSTITNTSWDDWRQRVSIFEYDDKMYYSGITLNNVFYKYISQLNSLIVDHPNIGTCIKGEQNVILKLALMDESIAETNKWYKGVIYMSEKCTNDTRIYLYIGDNNIYGDLSDKYFEIYPGEKIEYLFKWSGKNTKPLIVSDTDYSIGGRYSCKYGDIIVFSNKTNRWKITKLENKIKELETQISTLLP